MMNNYRANAPRVRGDAAYLSFSKGEWAYGREKRALDLDTSWLVHPASFFHGYICWRDGNIFAERIVPAGAPLPAETSLPEPPEPKPDSDDQDGYQYQLGFKCVCIEGSHKELQLTFKIASVGGTGAVQKLFEDFDARLGEAEALETETVFPIVRFDTDSYMHKKRGKIWVPVIEIIGFSDGQPDGEVEWLEGANEVEETPPPPPVKKERLRRTAK